LTTIFRFLKAVHRLVQASFFNFVVKFLKMKTEPNFGTAPKRILLAILVLGLCALMTWSGARYALWQSDRNTFSAHWPLPSGQSARLTTASMAGMPDFIQACEQSTPAVVYIKTTSTQTMRSFNDWFFGDFFQQNPQTVLNSGSGVLISADGYLVTNHHVVHQAQKIEVVLANKQTYTAELVGQDPGSDLALLKIQGNALPFMAFANSTDLRVGEWVLAVGNPFNLTSTVTAGIVSAKGRNLNLLNNMFPIEAFIQTDAAINPGNSGGALINTAGLLVGINTAILSKTGSYNGYGFAIPSNIVRKVVADLREFGKVQRAFMGIDVVDLDEKLRKEAELEHMNGVFVTSVSPIGGAHDAGIQAGDVLIGLDKVPLRTKSDFDEQLSYHRPGESVEITLERKGKILTKKIRLTNLNGDTEIQKNSSVRSSDLGCELEPLTQYELDRLKTNHGVRIASVQAGTLSRMGLREGFVITHINKAPVKTPLEVIDALSKVRGQTVIEGFDQNGGRAVYSFYGF